MSDRWSRRLVSALNVAHQGIWLGVLRRRDLPVVNAVAYAAWDRYHGIDHNRSGLTDWERRAVERHFLPGSTVVVPSAGGGRELLGLEALGYGAVGFDPAATLVESGQRFLRESASRAQLGLVPPDGLPPDLEGPFDAILVGWGGYAHIQGHRARIRFIRSLRGLVEQDAPMLISFFLRSPDDRTFRATKRLATVIRRIRRSSESIELGDSIAATFDHYFAWGEVESEVAEGGFVVIETSSVPYPHLMCRAV